MSVSVLWDYLLVVSEIARYLGNIAVAIVAWGVVFWAIQERHEWPLKTALRMTASLALVLVVVGVIVYVALVKPGS